MKFKSGAIIGGGAALAGAAATWATLTMLPGTFLAAHAQLSPALLTNGKVAVVTPAMREAATMQSAFNQVAHDTAPAVVTITTTERMPASRGYRIMPGGGNRRGGSGDPFGDLFRQFGFPNGPQGGQGGQGGDDSDGGGGSFTPNGATAPSMGPVRSGLGSGFIVRPDGLILTNAHVVQGADTVTVKLSDGREFKNAKVLGSDTESDVAVVKVPATNLPTVALGESDEVNVGDWAIAVGNPYGLDHTVTVGVISAKGRVDPGGGSSRTYFQTDASINPGNSGGPLLDIYGKVIGINNSIYSESGGNVGIGFAIPIDTARKIANELAQNGSVRRARLNMNVEDVTPATAQSFGLDANTRGVLVGNVIPDGPAAHAGIQAGDIITAIDGKPVSKTIDLIATVSDTPAGASVKLDILRNGTHQTITAQPTELKSNKTAAKPGADNPDSDAQSSAGTLGVQLTPLTADIAQQLGVPASTKGLVIGQVLNGSPAQAAGLTRGMIIERVGQTPVTSVADMKAAIKSILSKETDEKSVALLVNGPDDNGGRTEHYVVVQPQ